MGIEEGTWEDDDRSRDELRDTYWPHGDDIYRGEDGYRVGQPDGPGPDERLPDGTTLAAHVEQAQRRARAVPDRHVAARYREYGSWLDVEQWAKAVDGRDEPARPEEAREPAREHLRAQPVRQLTLATGDVFILGDPRQVESFQQPWCVDCGRPVPWRAVPVTIGLDVTPDGGRTVAYAFRASVATCSRCRRQAERRIAAAAIRQVGPIVRTLVEGIGPPTVAIGRTLVEAVAPVVTSPIRDGQTAGLEIWQRAAGRVRAWTRHTTGEG
jgi:hypothetical protein